MGFHLAPAIYLTQSRFPEMPFVGMKNPTGKLQAGNKRKIIMNVRVSQVRCAAVFALGTFVGNSAERTDHSTTIDHNVAMMLAQLINDGSPMVRKVQKDRRHPTLLDPC